MDCLIAQFSYQADVQHSRLQRLENLNIAL